MGAGVKESELLILYQSLPDMPELEFFWIKGQFKPPSLAALSCALWRLLCVQNVSMVGIDGGDVDNTYSEAAGHSFLQVRHQLSLLFLYDTHIPVPVVRC